MGENLMEQSFFCQVVRHCCHLIIVQLHRGYQCLFQFLLRRSKHVVPCVMKCLGFAFLRFHMILFVKTLKRCFWDKVPWKTVYAKVFISIQTFSKNNPTKFCFRCRRLIFISHAYVYVRIYMKHSVQGYQLQSISKCHELHQYC